MKKIMGHVTGKLSLSILTMFVLLVGVLAGLDKVTTTQVGSKTATTASSTIASPVAAAAIKAASSSPATNNTNPAAKSLQNTPKDVQTARELAKKRPLVFEPNRGQSDKEVQYFARSAGYAVFMTSPASAVLQFHRGLGTPAEQVTMKLNGANEKAEALPQEATGGTSTYHIGSDSSKWLEAIPNYAKLRYNNVYPGIDVVYQGDGKNFRHDFVVQPGADPKSIHLSYEGGKGTTIDAQGRMVVALSQGSVTASKPYVYQEYGGAKHEVSGGYVLMAQNDAQFEVGSYDRSQALVIDPGYTYASYAFTAADSFETEITGVGLSSTVLMACGWTFSPTLDKALTGGQQIAFINSASPITLAAGTTSFVGGTTGNTQANGCALSATGATVMVGVTNSGTTFPTASSLSPNPATNVNFNKHGFVSSAAVTGLIAGNGSDIANAVAFDNKGNIHIVGATSSGSQGSPVNNLLTSMVPTCFTVSPPVLATCKAAQPEFESKTSTNAFYLELVSGKVAYGTFLGGYDTDEANAVATDPSGNAYITGDATSWGRPYRWENFPVQPPQTCAVGVTIGCLPPTNPPTTPIMPYTFSVEGQKHAWVAAINPNATNTNTPPNTGNGPISPTLLWSLPIGGDINPAEQDIGTAIAVDINYNVYIGGNTQNPSIAGCNATTGLAIGGPVAIINPQLPQLPICIDTDNTLPGTNNSNFNVVFTAPGVICPSPVLNLTSDQESSTNNCSNPGSAAGPGVVATLTNLNGGAGYTVGQAVTFSAPDLAPLGGHTATGFVGSVNGNGTVLTVWISNQGSGYITPPTITFPAPSGIVGVTSAQASATVVVGAVILGNFSSSVGVAQDGWVIQLNAPSPAPSNQNSTGALINNTFNFNGGTLKAATPVFAPFPAFVFGTLVNGDEVNGNGTSGAKGVNPANCLPANAACPPNNVNQVTGIVTDYGAIPGAVAGSAGPLGNIYISGSTTDATGGSLRAAFDAAIIRRRINANATDQITGATLSTLTETPFSNIYLAAEAGVINNLGDLDLGTAVAAGGSAAVKTDAFTGATFSGTTDTTVTLTGLATAPPADVVGSNVTITGVVTKPTLSTITSAASPVYSGTGTIYWVTFTTPTFPTSALGPALAVGQLVTIAGSANANYNVGGNVLAAGAYPGVPAPTGTTFSLAFGTNPGAFPDAPGNDTIAVANGYNGSFKITAVTATTLSFTVTVNPGLYLSGGNAALPAVAGGNDPIGAATGVAYDPATGRSCIGGWTGLNLPSDPTKGGIFLPPPSDTVIGSNTFAGIPGVQPPGFPLPYFNGFLPNANNAMQPGEMIALNANGIITDAPALAGTTPATVTEGILACAVYNNDVTLTSANPVITFQMVAGATALTQYPTSPNLIALSTLNPLNQITISVTNPNSVPQASFIPNPVWYTPPPFGGSPLGPASASHPNNQWLHIDTTPGGTSYTLSLLHPLSPQDITPASNLDPGFYQATFNIVPSNGAGDNAGVPIVVTVNLTVTGTILTNTVFAGGVPTPNAGPAPTGGAPVVLNEGAGWADGSGMTEFINIPIAAQVPVLSPSFSDIVFDVLRDSNGAPVVTNTSTQWPVLGPPSTGAVQSLTMSNIGANYTCSNGNSVGTPGNCAIPLLFCVSPVTATTQTCGPPPGPACTTVGQTNCSTQAQGTAYVDPTTGTINSYVITTPGSGYSSPPFVVFPLPNAGGTQAQAIVNLTGAPNLSVGGGVVDLHPIQFGPFGNLIPGAVGCGQTPFALAALPDALTNSSACYIQVRLPQTMLSGAPAGTYSGTFYLYVNSGQLNVPSIADETLPGISSITFSPVGSSGTLSNCFPLTSPGCNPPPATLTLMAVTINVLVNPGSMVLQSPWISNVNPAIPAPPFVLNPSILPAVPLAPFSVPVNYTGTITSNNNGLPYIAGITGNTKDYHSLRLDSRNLLTGNNTGTFLATVTPGINQAAAVALALSATPPITTLGNGLPFLSLPIFTCTTSSPPIPSSILGNAGILQYTHDGNLQAASASVTTTDVTVSIVNPSSLAPGYYASTITYAALTAGGQPVTNNNNQPVQVSLPVCLKVGNTLAYEYEVEKPNFADDNVVASGQPTTGMLFMEAGSIETVQLDVYGLGPSQNVNLPANVQGGPQFAPPDSTLELPALFSPLNTPAYTSFNPTPLNPNCTLGTGPTPGQCSPYWIAPTQVQPAATTPGKGIEGGTSCVNSFGVGTEPVNTCTPAAMQLVVSPPQTALPGTYPNPLNPGQYPAGGVSVTDIALPTQPLLLASNSGNGLGGNPPPMPAILPVTITSGPGMLYSVYDPSATACNGTNPTGPSCGTVYAVILAPPGFGGSLYSAPPNITFSGGGCAVQPTAVATVLGGSINAIYLTSLGGGCQTPPQVHIDPPTNPGGAQAEAAALVSDGTINLNFTEVVGSLTTIPSSETITVLPSRIGTTLGFLFPLPSLQSPTNPLWLAFAFSSTGCTPFVQYDPTQSLPGFFNGCSINVTPNILAAGLPVGQYTAWQVLQSGPLFPPNPQPHFVAVVVTLNVLPQGGIPCSITLRDAINGTSTTMPYVGSSTSPPQGMVSVVNVVTGGAGYTTPPTVTFTGGGCAVEPTAQATLGAGGGIVGVPLTSFGSGCATPPTVTIGAPPAGGTQATASVPGINVGNNAGFYPSVPLTLTVTPNSATTCGPWTVTTQDISPTAATPSVVVSVPSGATGSGVGTLSYNVTANTHLVTRSSTITVTASGASATYTVNEAASPLLQLQRETEALYQRALGREPDTGGFNFWTCTTPLIVQPCANLPNVGGLGQMVDLFLSSSSAQGLNAPLNAPPGQASVGEGESSDFQVIAIYQAVLGRLPVFAEWQAGVAPFRLNETPAGWALAATNLLNSLVNGQEYATKYGPPNNVSNEVTQLYKNVFPTRVPLGPTGTELANGMTIVSNGGTGGMYNLFYNLCIAPPLSQPAPPLPPYPTSFDTSAEFQNRTPFASTGVANDHTNTMFVTMLYFAVLGRDPDPGGLAFWLGIANGGGSGIFFAPGQIGQLGLSAAVQAGVNARQTIEGSGSAPGTPGIVNSLEFQTTFNF